MSFLGAQNSIALGVQGLIHIDTGVVGSTDYLLAKSLRFRASASAYLNRTFAAGNQSTWTWSAWVKRGVLGTYPQMFSAGAGTGGSPELTIVFEADALRIDSYNGSTTVFDVKTTALYRDPAAWYHVVVAFDTTQATAADRVKFYINGQQITSFATASYPGQNTTHQINAATSHQISGSTRVAAYYYDGEMAEINFVGGYPTGVTSGTWAATNVSTIFGAYSIYNQWLPKAYTGTYGTNGFYLPFTNTASTSTLVADSSGNGNNWTPNNISLTAGSTYDSLTDVPTLTSETVANYAVLNPLQKGGSVNPSSGNLQYLNTASAYFKVFSTIGITSGKWYVEYVIVASSAITNGRTAAGLARYDVSTSDYFGFDTYSWGSINTPGNNVYNSNIGKALTTGAFVAGDVLMLAYDADAGKLWFGVKGAWDNGNDPSTGSTPSYSTNLLGSTGPFFFGVHGYTSPDNTAINFGQQPFTYTAPSGFLPLNTFNI